MSKKDKMNLLGRVENWRSTFRLSVTTAIPFVDDASAPSTFISRCPLGSAGSDCYGSTRLDSFSTGGSHHPLRLPSVQEQQ